MAVKHKTPDQRRARLVAKVLRDVVGHDSFETLADLTDALKFKLARLRIGWTNDDINTAFRLVGSNVELVHPVPTPVISVRPAPAFGRDEARRIWQQLERGVHMWQRSA